MDLAPKKNSAHKTRSNERLMVVLRLKIHTKEQGLDAKSKVCKATIDVIYKNEFTDNFKGVFNSKLTTIGCEIRRCFESFRFYFSQICITLQSLENSATIRIS